MTFLYLLLEPFSVTQAYDFLHSMNVVYGKDRNWVTEDGVNRGVSVVHGLIRNGDMENSTPGEVQQLTTCRTYD